MTLSEFLNLSTVDKATFETSESGRPEIVMETTAGKLVIAKHPCTGEIVAYHVHGCPEKWEPLN